jgi:hypothetical protein
MNFFRASQDPAGEKLHDMDVKLSETAGMTPKHYWQDHAKKGKRHSLSIHPAQSFKGSRVTRSGNPLTPLEIAD